MNGGMQLAERLTLVRGAAAASIYHFVFFSFLFCAGVSFSFHMSAGMKGSGGELRHLAG
jgi:hypothetical protein